MNPNELAADKGMLIGPWEVLPDGRLLVDGKIVKDVKVKGKVVRRVPMVPVPKPCGATRPCAHFSKKGAKCGYSINDAIPDDWKTVQFPHILDIGK